MHKEISTACITYLYSQDVNYLVDSLNHIELTSADLEIIEKYGFEILIEIIKNITLNEEAINYLWFHNYAEVFEKPLIRYQKLPSEILKDAMSSCITGFCAETIYTRQKLPPTVIDFCIENQYALDALLLHQDLTEEEIKKLLLYLDDRMEDYRIEWIIKSLPESYYPILLTHKCSYVRNLAKSLLKS